MILDELSMLKRYKGISPSIDRAIDYLVSNDAGALPDGRHPIDGDRVVATAMTYATKPAAEGRFEAHRKYIDIQILIRGQEACLYRPLSGLAPAQVFDEEADIGFYEGKDGVRLPLRPGLFALFFPHDAHMPSLDLEGRSEVRKVVVKVAAE